MTSTTDFFSHSKVRELINHEFTLQSFPDPGLTYASSARPRYLFLKIIEMTIKDVNSLWKNKQVKIPGESAAQQHLG